MRKFYVIGLITIGLLFCGFMYRIEIANLPMSLIVRNDQPEKKADFILIMMGSVFDRAKHGAKLYRQGYGDKIIFAEAERTDMIEAGFRTPDGEATKAILLAEHVREGDIIFLNHTLNTSSQEEVEVVLNHIKDNYPEAKRVLLVTSWYHSSRALWISEKNNHSDIILESAPTPSPPTWWEKERDFLAVYNEYLKWVYYRLKY